MKIVIDVNGQTYKDIKNYGEIFDGQIHILTKSIINGTPLEEELEAILAEEAELSEQSGFVSVAELISKRIAELKGE